MGRLDSVVIDDELRRSIVRSAEMRYLPNKLHGDELVFADGRVFTEHNDEWLDAEEIESLLLGNVKLPLVMVDRSEPMAAVYEFRPSGVEAWRSVIKARYISADGLPPTGLDFYFLAHEWADTNGEKLLLFELEC